VIVSDLIIRAVKEIGGVAKAEPLSADELTDGFNILNDMLDAWAAERLLIYQLVRSTYPLTANKQTYTIGVGGDFNAVRPVWIQDAGLINVAYTPTFELPVRILTIDEWAALTIKSQQATQSWYLWNDYGFPLSTLSLWPVPSVSTLQLALYVPTPISQFANVNATVSFPPGYAEALRYNLAVRLCPSWGKQLDPVLANMASESLRTIQRANERFDTLGVDNALIGGADRGVFNYLTGQSTGMRNT